MVVINCEPQKNPNVLSREACGLDRHNALPGMSLVNNQASCTYRLIGILGITLMQIKLPIHTHLPPFLVGNKRY